MRLPLPEFIIPRRVFKKTFEELRQWGKKRYEGLVLWIGQLEGSRSIVQDILVPDAEFWGGGVRLQQGDLLKLVRELADRNLILLAQLHTHPGNFGHSFGDERSAISYRLGYVSIVVPNYARKEHADLRRCHVYLYEGNLRWRKLSASQISRQFRLV